MKNFRLLFAMLPLVLLYAACGECKEDEDLPTPKTQSQTIIVKNDLIRPELTKGFYGFITEWKGNFMPPGPYQGTIDSVQKDVYVYKETGFDEIKAARIGETFWSLSKMPFDPLYIIRTNNKGFVEADLPAGSYSVFVLLDSDRLYRNSFDGKGKIGKIILDGSSLMKLDLKIDYEASY